MNIPNQIAIPAANDSSENLSYYSKMQIISKKESLPTITSNLFRKPDIQQSFDTKSILNSSNKTVIFNTKRASMHKNKKKCVTILQMRKLKKCNSKYTFRQFLIKSSPVTRQILLFYMRECFILDVYTRRLENKRFLLAKREIFYEIIRNPELLSQDCHFDNNSLKNFCTGAGNFILKNLKKIFECFRQRGIVCKPANK